MTEYFNGDDFYGDCAIMECYLNEMEFYSGTERQKLYRHSNATGNVGSMLYGYTWRGYLSKTKTRTKSQKYLGLYQTKCKDLYPLFESVAEEFSSLYFPDFEWFNLQLNKCFPIPPHYDSVNVGTSIILGLGDYTGGLLNVEYPDGVKEIDIQGQTYEFDGSKYKHWVDDFTGTRYSIVFFKNKMLMNKAKKVVFDADLIKDVIPSHLQ